MELIESFIPESFKTDKELVTNTKISLYTNFLVLATAILFAAIYYLFGNKLGASIILVNSIIPIVNLKLLKKTLSLSLFANLLCLSAFIDISTAMTTAGGVSENLGFCWLFPLSILSFVLLKNKYGWMWVFISIINYFMVLIIDKHFYKLPNLVNIQYRSFIDMATIVGSLLVLGGFAQIFQSGVDRSQDELKKEKSLVEDKIKEAIQEIEEKNLQISITNKKIDDQNKNLEQKNNDLENSLKNTEKTQKDLEVEKEKLKENQIYLENSINEILDKMMLFSNGDLTVKIESKNNDYISNLYQGFSSAVLKIKEMVENVVLIIEKTNYVSNNIHNKTSILLKNLEKQNQQIENVSSASNQLSVISIENSKTTSKTMNQSKNNKEVAENGGQVVLENIYKIQEIGILTQESSKKINDLNKSMKNISEVISIIDDISDQTNLLALNASIEAARAGEHGRGFSVVAQEIKKLSEKTLQATKDIEVYIFSVQNQAKESVSIMSDVNSKVSEGTQFSNQARNSLKNIVDSSDNLLDMVNQIAAAIEEQSFTSNSISENLLEINHLSANSYNNLNDIYDSNQELKELIDNLKEVSDNFVLK